jgi:single-strand DNA-binding protein
MNEITIHGNLTDEPALHHSPTGVAVLTFCVAVNGRRFDRQTHRWADTAPVFHRVVAFQGLADNAAACLTKGTTVAVTGELVDDSFQPDEGRKIWRSKLVADDIAISLRFATGQVTKTRRDQPAEPTEVPDAVHLD